MQYSVLSLITVLAGGTLLQAQLQPVSPELQSRALELLRQTMSQETQQPIAPAPQLRQPLAEPLPSMRPTTQQTSRTARAPRTPRVPEKVQTRRTQRPAQQPMAPGAPTAPEQVTSMTPMAPMAPTTPSPAPAQIAPITPAFTPGINQFSGPKTKQQRLAELLDLYRADKLTPAEYQSERARIVAEP